MLKRLKFTCKIFNYLLQYNSKYIGVSPSGKATDSDSVISLVRIHLPLPREIKATLALLLFFVKIAMDSNGEKNCLQFCRRLKGGHPPFIGEGRTGAESIYPCQKKKHSF